MFTQLEQLLNNSEKLSLTIKKSGGKLIVSTTATIPNPDTEISCKVRESLSAPFVVSATAQELDAGYVGALETHVKSYTNSALTLSGDKTQTSPSNEPLSDEQVSAQVLPSSEFANIEEL